MGKLSGLRSFFTDERRTVDLLAKACAHAAMKAIGVKTTVITSAIFAVGVFNLKKKKRRFDRFLPGRLAMYFSYLWGIVV